MKDYTTRKRYINNEIISDRTYSIEITLFLREYSDRINYVENKVIPQFPLAAYLFLTELYRFSTE